MKTEIRFFLGLLLLFCIIDCIYIQNKRLSQINYPETPYYSGFIPGKNGVNKTYFRDWCDKFCKPLKEITESLSEEYFLEIRGKMDATELPKDREKISLGRANSVKQMLSDYGIPNEKLKAIADPEPNQYLGRDKFDPENRKVQFRIQKKE